MDERTKAILDRETERFYLSCTDSFSNTRQAPWPGWDPVANRLSAMGEKGIAPRILDAGCGNLRFERFLLDRSIPFFALCLDRCEPMMQAALSEDVRLRSCCRAAIFDGLRPTEWNANGIAPCSAAVAFGLLHHIPGFGERLDLLRALSECVQPGGLLAVSLWDLESDPRLSRKADRDTQRACKALGFDALEEDDYILGWQDQSTAFRYCHSFPDSEVDCIVEAMEPLAHLVERYRSDGPSGRSNTYLLFDKC